MNEREQNLLRFAGHLAEKSLERGFNQGDAEMAADFCTPLARSVPQAAFNMGRLHEAHARFILDNPELPPEMREEAAGIIFSTAAKHYMRAANMPSAEPGDLYPARALNALAFFHEQGLSEDGVEDKEKALRLFLQAAEMGLAEANMQVAIKLYEFEGSKANNQAAHNHLMLASYGVARDGPYGARIRHVAHSAVHRRGARVAHLD